MRDRRRKVDLALAFSRLATMNDHAVPMIEALQATERDCRLASVAAVFSAMREEILEHAPLRPGGVLQLDASLDPVDGDAPAVTLANGAAKAGGVPEHVLSLLRAGEKGRQLNLALNAIAELLQRELELR